MPAERCGQQLTLSPPPPPPPRGPDVLCMPSQHAAQHSTAKIKVMQRIARAETSLQ